MLLFNVYGIAVAADSPSPVAPDPAVTSSSEMRKHDQAKLRQWLADRQFVELDGFTDDLRRSRGKYRDGQSRLMYALAVLQQMKKEELNDKGYQEKLQLLNDWLAARPDSVTARLLLAKIWIGYGWLARGSGYANTVTPEGWRLLEERVLKSKAILDDLQKSSTKLGADYYCTRLLLGRGLGEAPDRKWVDTVLKDDPGNLEITNEMAQSLLPRWFGAPGELEEFADDVVERTKDQVGDLQYTCIFDVAVSYHGLDVFNHFHLDWDKFRKGLVDRERLYPDVASFAPWAARTAQLQGDYDTAIQYAAKIESDDVNLAYWGNDKWQYLEWKTRLNPKMKDGGQELLILPRLEPPRNWNVTPDGQAVVILNEGSLIEVFSLTNGDLLTTFHLPRQVFPLKSRISWKHQTIYSSVYDVGGLHMTSLTDGQAKLYPELAKEQPHRLEVSPDESLLAICHPDYEGHIDLLDLKTSKLGKSLPLKDSDFIYNVVFSPDCQTLAVSARHYVNRMGVKTSKLTLFNVKTGAIAASWAAATASVQGMAWSPDGQQLAVVNSPAVVCVYDVKTQKKVAEYKDSKDRVSALAFSPDGKTIAVGSRSLNFIDPAAGETLVLWDYAKTKSARPLKGHQFGVGYLHYIDNTTLVSGGNDWTTRVWKLDKALKQ